MKSFSVRLNVRGVMLFRLLVDCRFCRARSDSELLRVYSVFLLLPIDSLRRDISACWVKHRPWHRWKLSIDEMMTILSTVLLFLLFLCYSVCHAWTIARKTLWQTMSYRLLLPSSKYTLVRGQCVDIILWNFQPCLCWLKDFAYGLYLSPTFNDCSDFPLNCLW